MRQDEAPAGTWPVRAAPRANTAAAPNVTTARTVAITITTQECVNKCIHAFAHVT